MSIDLTLPKEKRILLAAEEIFSKYGYEKATLDEIISLADVGKGTVYKYYGNKERNFYAEDIVQDSFIKLYRARKRFESEQHIKYWLIRVTINECLNIIF